MKTRNHFDEDIIEEVNKALLCFRAHTLISMACSREDSKRGRVS